MRGAPSVVRSLGCLAGFLIAFGVTLPIAPSAPAAAAASSGVEIAAGERHTCVLTSAGGVKCWGANQVGQLGDGSTSARSVPEYVVGLTGKVAHIASGGLHSCALSDGGGLQCWGSNLYGELGNPEEFISSSSPVDVKGLTSGVKAVAAGERHTCALLAGGTVKCWGDNSRGQLGDGSMTSSPEPVDVSGLAGGAVAIAAGGLHTCALTVAGGIKCWGANSSGQLGDGTTTEGNTAVDVTGLSTGALQVSAGGLHTCALTAAAGVMCWGANDFGQLGNGSTGESDSPVPVSGLTSGVRAISAGGLHSCALVNSGAVDCWGSDGAGQLGDGSVTDRSAPVTVVGLTSGVIAISAGGLHACALGRDGAVACWGANSFGEDGVGDPIDASGPTAVSGLRSGAQALGAGGSHTCAVGSDGGVQCWGDGLGGELGSPSPLVLGGLPLDVVGLPGPVRAMAAGALHTCELSLAGGVACWGARYGGTPVEIVGLTGGVTSITANGSHTCAVTAGGGVKCWGENLFGELGNGTTDDSDTPVDVSGLTNGVTAIAAGEDHTCAITGDGGVKCWGANFSGSLGNGGTDSSATPVDVVGLTGSATAVAAGWGHTCVLTKAGAVRCWGLHGALGNDANADSAVPVDVSGLSGGVKAISAGEFFNCALTSQGGVKCWGNNAHGQLGVDDPGAGGTPVDVPGLASRVTAIASGYNHTCALQRDGTVKCWGADDFGQLGLNGGSIRLRPALVDLAIYHQAIRLRSSRPGGPLVEAIAAGGSSTCALVAAGRVKCWGGNYHGELGDGSRIDSSTPVDVIGLSGVTAIVASSSRECALTRPGAVRCWGDGSLVPVEVPRLARGVQAITAGVAHTCALTEAGGVKCWGDNSRGQLGDGSTTSSDIPIDVRGLSRGVRAIAAGGFHTCAVTVAGDVRCWGDNSHGALGIGSTHDSGVPVRVTGLPAGIRAIAAGAAVSCAITSGGRAMCWGSNFNGQLGNGTTTDSQVPVQVSGLSRGVGMIAASPDFGEFHICALMAAGEVKCWGANSSGELGDGTRTDRHVPVHVRGLDGGISSISAGDAYTCAVARGRAECWGNNHVGQLGDGTTDGSLRPVDVAFADQGGSLAKGTALTFTAFVTEFPPSGGRASVRFEVFERVAAAWHRVAQHDVASDSAGRARFRWTFATSGAWFVRARAEASMDTAASQWSPPIRYTVR